MMGLTEKSRKKMLLEQSARLHGVADAWRFTF
jgi:hypothetical protein